MSENTDPQTGSPDDAVDPDGDPGNLPSPPDTSGMPTSTGPADTLSVQDDPDDEDDPDADPEMLGH